MTTSKYKTIKNSTFITNLDARQDDTVIINHSYDIYHYLGDIGREATGLLVTKLLKYYNITPKG